MCENVLNLHPNSWGFQKIGKKKVIVSSWADPVIGHTLIVVDWSVTVIGSWKTY
jgi:hypothetical protein